jgi:hypothetical protein
VTIVYDFRVNPWHNPRMPYAFLLAWIASEHAVDLGRQGDRARLDPAMTRG